MTGLFAANTSFLSAVGKITLGGFGGDAGVGGTVSVTNYGVINTGLNANGVVTGNSSYGIFAQSVGGGGGSGGNASSGFKGLASVGGFGGATGDGGAVTVQNYDGANISTLGTGADAIMAQSVGGGGGDVAIAGNNAAPLVFPVSASTVPQNAFCKPPATAGPRQFAAGLGRSGPIRTTTAPFRRFPARATAARRAGCWRWAGSAALPATAAR